MLPMDAAQPSPQSSNGKEKQKSPNPQPLWEKASTLDLGPGRTLSGQDLLVHGSRSTSNSNSKCQGTKVTAQGNKFQQAQNANPNEGDEEEEHVVAQNRVEMQLPRRLPAEALSTAEPPQSRRSPDGTQQRPQVQTGGQHVQLVGHC